MTRSLVRAVAVAAVGAALLLDSGSASPLLRTGPGSLDQRFGSGGKVTTIVAPSAYANAVALAPDGAIIAAGSAAVDDASRFAVVRYRPDGTVDNVAATAFGPGSAFANAVAPQSDGRVVVAGFAAATGETSGTFALARYDADGALDRSFGDGGRVTTALAGPAVANGVSVQSDGKIVAAGTVSGTRDRFALVRYEPNGTLDPTFGVRGVVTTSVGAGSGLTSLALAGDGSIVAAGWSATEAAVRFAVARYRTDGSLDPSFGRGGVTTTAIGEDDTADDVLIQPDGKIVVGGGSLASSYDRFGVARYRRNGTLDPSFGNGGRVATSVGSGNIASPIAIAVEPDGKLLAVGSSEANWMVSFAVARYDARGRLDRGFGEHGGVVTTKFDLDRAFARGAVLQRDGKIVVAGYADYGGSYRFALARYVVVGCVVPDVRGARIRVAARTIRLADCALGRVSSAFSRRTRAGRVVAERPAAGARLPQGAKVDLVLSRGPKR